MISHYIEAYANANEGRSIEAALLERGDARSHYLDRSRYHMQLEQYWSHFSKEQLLVITQEDLFADRAGTLQDVFRFLEVDDTFRSPLFRVRRHRSNEKRRKDHIGTLLHRLVGKRFDRPHPSPLLMYVERVLYRPFSRPIPRPRLSDELRRRLVESLQNDVARLRASTGLTLEAWSL